MELYHYGVKGMKWGVRRYQNADGSLTTEGRKHYSGAVSNKALYTSKENLKIQDRWRRKAIKQATGKNTPSVVKTNQLDPFEDINVKKGKNVTHLTKNTKIDPESGKVLFVLADEGDKKLYRSVLAARIMKHTKTDTVNDITIKLKNDLRAPSRNESIKIFRDMFDDTMRKTLLKHIDIALKEGDPDDIPTLNKFKNSIEKGTKSALENDGYRFFNWGFTVSSMLKEPSYQKYISEIKSRGYNSLIDDNDSKYNHMGGKVPLIILDELALVGDQSVSEIRRSDIFDTYEDWLRSIRS